MIVCRFQRGKNGWHSLNCFRSQHLIKSVRWGVSREPYSRRSCRGRGQIPQMKHMWWMSWTVTWYPMGKAVCSRFMLNDGKKLLRWRPMAQNRESSKRVCRSFNIFSFQRFRMHRFLWVPRIHVNHQEYRCWLVTIDIIYEYIWYYHRESQGCTASWLIGIKASSLTGGSRTPGRRLRAKHTWPTW